MMLKDYIFYMAYLTDKLQGFFEKQSPYIYCKKGCAKCCQEGEYPFSQAEFDFLMIGFSKLSAQTQKEITTKIDKIKEQKKMQSKTGETFLYECPFLINNECSVYEFRGIICRSFGLIAINDKGNSKIPFCAFQGLNYSNVLDVDTKIISSEKFKKLNTDKPPLAYNVGYNILTSEDIEKNFHIEFGEKKALIDWF